MVSLLPSGKDDQHLPPLSTFQAHFGRIDDPRIYRNKPCHLLDIIAVAVRAVIFGADSWPDVAAWGEINLDWLREYLALPSGTAVARQLLRCISSAQARTIRERLSEWGAGGDGRDGGQLIALDGKTVRRSHDHRPREGAIHLVSAWATDNWLVPGQVHVDENSNEIADIPALMQVLALRASS